MDPGAVHLPEMIITRPVGVQLASEWISIPWEQLTQWTTSLDSSSNDIRRHCLDVSGSTGEITIWVSNVSDNVALLDAVRASGQTP